MNKSDTRDFILHQMELARVNSERGTYSDEVARGIYIALYQLSLRSGLKQLAEKLEERLRTLREKRMNDGKMR